MLQKNNASPKRSKEGIHYLWGCIISRYTGRFETPLAVSKRPNHLLGRFETFLGFEMAWPVSKWPNQLAGHFETSPDF